MKITVNFIYTACPKVTHQANEKTWKEPVSQTWAWYSGSSYLDILENHEQPTQSDSTDEPVPHERERENLSQVWRFSEQPAIQAADPWPGVELRVQNKTLHNTPKRKDQTK